jgi:hypothetical protein
MLRHLANLGSIVVRMRLNPVFKRPAGLLAELILPKLLAANQPFGH